MFSSADSYPADFFGQLRLYVDYLAVYIVATMQCYAVFFLCNLTVLFFTIDQSWSFWGFLGITAIGSLVSMVLGFKKVFQRIPEPKMSRTIALVPVSVALQIFPLFSLGLYLAACFVQHQFNRRTLTTMLQLCALVPYTFLLIVIMRFYVQARYIPSSNMAPNLQINDRLIIESISKFRGTPLERGQIVVFNAPRESSESKLDGLLILLGDRTGWPVFPQKIAYIERVIGLPGDILRIREGDGVYLNGQKLDEKSYILEPANYNLNNLSDIEGSSADGELIHPYDSNGSIVVPPHMMFVLGDSRNNSLDSHAFGFVDQSAIVGRAWELIWPIQSFMHEPNWHRPNTPL